MTEGNNKKGYEEGPLNFEFKDMSFEGMDLSEITNWLLRLYEKIGLESDESGDSAIDLGGGEKIDIASMGEEAVRSYLVQEANKLSDMYGETQQQEYIQEVGQTIGQYLLRAEKLLQGPEEQETADTDV